MTLREFFRREVYVALHGQSLTFRLVKWLLILLGALSLYQWKGTYTLGVLFGVLFFLGMGLHFFFRWKSKGWTESWWLYKKIPLDEN